MISDKLFRIISVWKISVSHSIHLSSTRNSLKPRSEPYWGPPIGNGRHLGFRKSKNGTGTWIARRRVEDEWKYGKWQVRHKYWAVEQCTKDFGYNKAKKAAEAKFKKHDVGISDQRVTIAEACMQYVDDLTADGRDKTARDSVLRFHRYVFDHEIG